MGEEEEEPVQLCVSCGGGGGWEERGEGVQEACDDRTLLVTPLAES